MNRQEKETLVASLKQDFTDSQASFVVLCRGLSVPNVQGLRKDLRGKGSTLRVAKARLMKLAADGIDEVDGLAPYFKDQIGLVFASDETPAIAKVLCDFAKKNKSFSVVACSFESQVLDSDAVVRMASLPSREVLLAQVVGLLNMPITKLALDLKMIIKKLLVAIKEIENKKSEEGA